MKIQFLLDESLEEPEIVIRAAAMTPDVQALIQSLGRQEHVFLTGYFENEAYPLNPKEIVRIFSENGKTKAMTKTGEYVLRLPLYEIEEKLNSSQFLRISNSEIINFNYVKRFDLSYRGTIGVELKDGHVSFVSRRRLGSIKKLLGL